jgi:ATP synthase protein I
MTGGYRSGPAEPGRGKTAATPPDSRDGPPEQNAGWAIFSYLLSGMVFYGLVGWLVSRWTHIALLFPVGMLVGLAAAILLIVLKYGRP